MTQILHQFLYLFLKANIAKNRGQCSEKVEGASVEADFWHGENIDHPEKKSSK